MCTKKKLRFLVFSVFFRKMYKCLPIVFFFLVATASLSRTLRFSNNAKVYSRVFKPNNNTKYDPRKDRRQMKNILHQFSDRVEWNIEKNIE